MARLRKGQRVREGVRNTVRVCVCRIYDDDNSNFIRLHEIYVAINLQKKTHCLEKGRKHSEKERARERGRQAEVERARERGTE